MTRPLNLSLWTFCLLMFGWGFQAFAAGDSPWNDYPGGDVNCDMMVNVQDVVATVNAALAPDVTLTPCGVDTCPEGEALVGGNCHSIIDLCGSDNTVACDEGEALVSGNCHSIIDLCGSDNTVACDGEGVEAVDVCCMEPVCLSLPMFGWTCLPGGCAAADAEECLDPAYMSVECRPTESHDASTFEAGYNSCADAMGSDDTPMSPGFTLVQSFADTSGSCETALQWASDYNFDWCMGFDPLTPGCMNDIANAITAYGFFCAPESNFCSSIQSADPDIEASLKVGCGLVAAVAAISGSCPQNVASMLNNGGGICAMTPEPNACFDELESSIYACGWAQ